MDIQTEITNLNSKLINIKTHKDVPYFNFKNKTFIAKACNVYDGDTFSVIFDFKGELIKYRCRCYGYDTPEMRPSRKKPNRDHEKKLALKAKVRIIELLEAHPSKLIKIECLDFDKYGRVLGNVYLEELGNQSVNNHMVEMNYGYAYFGGTKKK